MSSENPAEFIFYWRIENFSLCFQPIGFTFDSPAFTVESFGGSDWFLRLSPRGQAVHHKHIIAFLHRGSNNNGGEEIRIDFTIDFIGGDGKVLSSVSVRNERFRKMWSGGNDAECEKLQLKNEMKLWPEDTLTIRCHMKNYDKPQIPSPVACSARSRIDADHGSIKLNLEIRNSRISHVLKMFSFSDSSQFAISAEGLENSIKVQIRKLGNSCPPQTVIYRLSLLHPKGYQVDHYSNTHLFEKADDILNACSLSTKQLEENLIKRKRSDHFTLCLEISASKGMELEELGEYVYRSDHEVKSFSTFDDDLRGIFENRRHSDVQLRVGDNVLLAHKTFLAARSPVFAAMFDQDMIENQTGVVDVVDSDTKTMTSFLEFIYTDSVREIDCDSASKLMILADKYQVISLKEKCSSFLLSALSVQNACNVFEIADIVGHEQLKTNVLDFIVSHAASILSSKEWSKWIENNIKLANEVFSKLAVKFDVNAIKKI